MNETYRAIETGRVPASKKADEVCANRWRVKL